MSEKLTTEKMMKSVFFMLDVVGCNPLNRNKYAIMRWLFMTSFTTLLFSLLTMKAITSLKNGISLESVENVLYVMLFIQFVFKYGFYYIHSQTLDEIFDTVFTKFWPTDYIKTDVEKFENLYKLIYTTMHLYRKNYIVLNALFGLEPLLHGTRTLRLPIWLPNEDILNSSPSFELIYTYEYLIMISADFAMLHFEIMCLFLLGTSYVQIEMIKTKFLKIGTPEFTYETFIECILHHNLILGHLNKIATTLSNTMLQQVITYFFAVCLPTYLFTSTGDINFGFAICSVINLINFYLYCLIGQFVYDQCLSVSDVLYNSNWLDTNDMNLQKGMIMVMNRSSKGVQLTAGGLLGFTLSTFMEVIKVLFSTLQFLWSTNDRNFNE